jgi:hypothetical protein
VLIHHAEFGIDQLYFGPSLLIIPSIDGLELGVPKDVSVLLLLGMNRPQQFFDDLAAQVGNIFQ